MVSFALVVGSRSALVLVVPLGSGFVFRNVGSRLVLVLVLRVWCWHAFAPSRLALDLVVLRARRFRFMCSLIPRLVLVDPVEISPESGMIAS